MLCERRKHAQSAQMLDCPLAIEDADADEALLVRVSGWRILLHQEDLASAVRLSHNGLIDVAEKEAGSGEWWAQATKKGKEIASKLSDKEWREKNARRLGLNSTEGHKGRGGRPSSR